MIEDPGYVVADARVDAGQIGLAAESRAEGHNANKVVAVSERRALRVDLHQGAARVTAAGVLADLPANAHLLGADGCHAPVANRAALLLDDG